VEAAANLQGCPHKRFAVEPNATRLDKIGNNAKSYKGSSDREISFDALRSF
jgi:hypothetical protein